MYVGIYIKSILFLILDRIPSIGFAHHICATINPTPNTALLRHSNVFKEGAQLSNLAVDDFLAAMS